MGVSGWFGWNGWGLYVLFRLEVREKGSRETDDTIQVGFRCTLHLIVVLDFKEFRRNRRSRCPSRFLEDPFQPTFE